MIATADLRAPNDGFIHPAVVEDFLGKEVEVVVNGAPVFLVVYPHLRLCLAHGYAAVECGNEPYIAACVQSPESAGERRKVSVGSNVVVPIFGEGFQQWFWVEEFLAAPAVVDQELLFVECFEEWLDPVDLAVYFTDKIVLSDVSGDLAVVFVLESQAASRSGPICLVNGSDQCH